MKRPFFWLVLGVAMGCLGCEPSLDVTPRVVDDQVVVEIKARGVNSVFRLKVEDESGNPIWILHDPDLKSKQPVVYGAVPEGTGKQTGPSQIFPHDNKPPKDIRGKTVVIFVEYQHDTTVAKSGVFRKVVEIP